MEAGFALRNPHAQGHPCCESAFRVTSSVPESLMDCLPTNAGGRPQADGRGAHDESISSDATRHRFPRRLRRGLGINRGTHRESGSATFSGQPVPPGAARRDRSGPRGQQAARCLSESESQRDDRGRRPHGLLRCRADPSRQSPEQHSAPSGRIGRPGGRDDRRPLDPPGRGPLAQLVLPAGPCARTKGLDPGRHCRDAGPGRHPPGARGRGRKLEVRSPEG